MALSDVKTLQESVEDLLAMLPADGGEMPYRALYEQAISSDPNAKAALKLLLQDPRRGMSQRVFVDPSTKAVTHFVRKTG